MFVRQSTHRRRHKPAKPDPSFPLTPHNNGQWCKKIRDKIRFFGIWEEPEAALENYLRVAADLHAGREPRSSTLSAEGLTVKPLCNHYLTYQHRRSQAGEIGPRWFEDCRTVLDSFVSFAGPGRLASDLAPDDFLRYRQRLSRQGLTGRKGLGVYALRQYVHHGEDGSIKKVVDVDTVGEQFEILLRKLNLKRKGIGFYTLRHTFRTWADEVRDQHAIHRIMGHTIPGMSGIYVEEISLDRLRAVVNHVREKLFGLPSTQRVAQPRTFQEERRTAVPTQQHDACTIVGASA
jgi:hypothetical protein